MRQDQQRLRETLPKSHIWSRIPQIQIQMHFLSSHSDVTPFSDPLLSLKKHRPLSLWHLLSWLLSSPRRPPPLPDSHYTDELEPSSHLDRWIPIQITPHKLVACPSPGLANTRFAEMLDFMCVWPVTHRLQYIWNSTREGPSSQEVLTNKHGCRQMTREIQKTRWGAVEACCCLRDPYRYRAASLKLRSITGGFVWKCIST